MSDTLKILRSKTPAFTAIPALTIIDAAARGSVRKRKALIQTEKWVIKNLKNRVGSHSFVNFPCIV